MAQIFIGFDPREAAAFAVARASAKRLMTGPVPVRGVVLADLRARGLYRRATVREHGQNGREVLWDTISGAPMSTEHAIARFFIGQIAEPQRGGWVVFMDGDVLIRANLCRLLDALDDSYAVACVHHEPDPEAFGAKMDGQVQLPYARKWWSSVFALNLSHPANHGLDLRLLNNAPGRDLHRFCWLNDDSLIGALDPKWNYLVGISPAHPDPAIVHFTLGTPDMAGYEHCEYADEWRAELARWAM